MRDTIHTDQAPAAIGPYAQAVKVGDTVYLSGQIPLDPSNGELVTGSITTQTQRVFDNLRAVCQAAGGDLKDIVRVGIYLDDLGNFAEVNDVMRTYFSEPYPARATVEVAALPKDVPVEIDAIMVVGSSG